MFDLIDILYKTSIPKEIASDPFIRMITYRGQDRIDATLMRHWLRMKRILERHKEETEYDIYSLVRKIEIEANHHMLAFHGLKTKEIL